MSPEAAEIHALRVLDWMAGHDDLLPVFLGTTGAELSDLRARAADPDFLASLIDFVLMDDAWVMASAAACGWPPERLAEIRVALPGGALPHWT